MSKYVEKFAGLGQEEVEQRKLAGEQNNFQENIAKSTQDILKDNILTLFNFLNLMIGVCLALVGAYSNLFFLVIILINLSIGIAQEIHARNLVKKLSLVTEAQVVVIRQGVEEVIPSTELVRGDFIVLSTGEQIPSDAQVVAGKIEVNEALLTGESDLITKEAAAELLSGSFIVSGQCLAEVIRVGADNYATKIASEAKVHKPIKSELLASLRKITKFTSYIIVPLGVILLLEGLFIRDAAIKPAVVAAAAALLGMLPKGLMLLISIALATAVTKLANKQVLVQEMYAVETLAHVDTICLDKTGTITEGKMKVETVHLLGELTAEEVSELMGSYLKATSDNNITLAALRDFYTETTTYTAREVLTFSSERKWAGVSFENYGTIVLGAPERLVTDLPEQVNQAQAAGKRVLLLAHTSATEIVDYQLPNLNPIALFEIDDPIRENASETLAYLKAEGIDVKVISGDNPITVSNIARRAGLADYANYLDLSSVEAESDVRAAASQYAVFGRVSPQQKRILVNELKAQDRVVAMTGDGVNDVLALREADCSIAMAEGDSATRQIANLILLDSDFSHLPEVLFEGRRVVNNVTKVASVFFIKTIYSFFLSLICAVTAIAFPFIPIQITLLDLAIEGYPAFFLSFEENKAQVKGQFLKTVLGNALPNALLVVFNTVIVYLYASQRTLAPTEMVTLMYYLLIGVSLIGVLKACLPLNPLRLFLIITTTVGTYVAAMLFHSILEITFLTGDSLLLFGILMALALVLKLLYHLSIEKHLKKIMKLA